MHLNLSLWEKVSFVAFSLRNRDINIALAPLKLLLEIYCSLVEIVLVLRLKKELAKKSIFASNIIILRRSN